MVDFARAREDFNLIVNRIGHPVTVLSGFTLTYSGTDYDEQYVSSGTTYSVSGVVQPLGWNDQSFIRQGVVKDGDQVLYLAGSVPLNANAVITFGGSKFSVIEGGIQNWDVGGSVVYKKAFIRNADAGSYGFI